jgi:hypothetical protein
LTGFLLLLAIGFSWLRNPPAASQAVGGLVFAALVFAFSEWIFARRMGLEVGREGLTLLGPLRRVHVPWADVGGLRWVESWRALTKYKFLYVETDRSHAREVPKDARLRVPTVTSPMVRSRDGREANVTELIDRVIRPAA